MAFESPLPCHRSARDPRSDKLLNAYLKKPLGLNCPWVAPPKPHQLARARATLAPVQVVSTLMIHTASGSAMEADIRIIVAAFIGFVDTHPVLVAAGR